MSEPRKSRPAKTGPDPELGKLSDRLDALGSRIAAERSERAAAEKPSVAYQGAKDYSKGFRLATEFVGGVLVGGLLGYGLDYLLGTLPLFLIIFLLLGFGAGILNMARAANRVSPAQDRLGQPPPRVADDDEEED
jgi:ATP synthase protein I